jgi:hypothetical protein
MTERNLTSTDDHAALLARFWAKVDKPADPKACWEWQGYRDQLGYGQFSIRLRPGRWRRIGTHRLAWELTYGRILPRIFVCHHCDNPPCVRPDHLFLGTPGDNYVDMQRKNRSPRHDGEHNGHAKLNEDQVRTIRRLLGHATQQQIAAAFGVTQILVSMIHRNRIWMDVTVDDSTTPMPVVQWPRTPKRGGHTPHVTAFKQEILTRRAAGESYNTIATACGFCPAAIWKWVKRWEQEGATR